MELFSESPLLMGKRKPRTRPAWVGTSLSPLPVVAGKAKYLSGRPEGTTASKLQRENQALCAPLLGMQLHTQRYPRRIQDFPHHSALPLWQESSHARCVNMMSVAACQ